jgi:transcription elongation factor/antiterminator RfaH
MSQNEQRRWFVIYSKAHKEAVAEFQLRLKGLDVFYPRLLLPDSLRKHNRIIPLFPNYLFVKINLWEEYHYVIWSPGVKRFVSFNETPAPIDDRILEYLMQLADSESIIRAKSNLKQSDEVRITGGPFDGLVGIIKEPPDAKGRVKVLLNLLQREIQVNVPVQYVAGGWVAAGQQGRSREIGSNLSETKS